MPRTAMVLVSRIICAMPAASVIRFVCQFVICWEPSKKRAEYGADRPVFPSSNLLFEEAAKDETRSRTFLSFSHHSRSRPGRRRDATDDRRDDTARSRGAAAAAQR